MPFILMKYRRVLAGLIGRRRGSPYTSFDLVGAVASRRRDLGRKKDAMVLRMGTGFGEASSV
jgi:hypothetical protein